MGFDQNYTTTSFLWDRPHTQSESSYFSKSYAAIEVVGMFAWSVDIIIACRVQG